MTLLGRIARFLFWLLVISWSVWLLRRVFGWMLQDAASGMQERSNASDSSQPPGAARRLVRDPVCGMHVDETLSIPMREDGELLHFCSIACRDAYVVSSKKFAANG
jgi:YHS domain-containing protein